MNGPFGVPRAAEWIAENDTLISRRGHRIAFRRRGAGATVLMLHGFPTWSYDYAVVASDLARDHDVVTLDFLGYGASDKPNPYEDSVPESADIVQDLVRHLGVKSTRLVIHDYGVIVGQELLDRASRGELGFAIESLVVLNAGIVYSEYRPTRMQKLLIRPVIGKLLASRVSAARVRAALDAVRGPRLTDVEFDDLWLGMSRDNGNKLWHLLIKYNAERKIHHRRWEAALVNWNGPMHLVWGLDDPVSGRHVLEQAIKVLPRATVTKLAGVGHFPSSEAPQAVAAAVRLNSR
ncbi:MAG TPA: alpha/beta hydrolase [Mycobacterium sp.]|nr:alpha/beta hydrolase [Mycobacterium sp.]